ncbi:peptidase M24 [Desulfobulbus propionicus DSM 2032]|jgi:Xaa-Pro aminopeptidase|uniref:Peptidase M24 n=1 Tax=Desulfobulbus propionicus (strain ATCC 33891 / DSM 2032 / VKM B-1956 / 1pr3) TaxID=577650 RepID=A0A7U4DQG6_DESPD|nr:Xaa-Pro peptidase family protein [Desulfobulbus propionicus]ADW19166.1 peptidase M24 [Desulfobulbus propionicus DSM 2032]
MTDMLYTPKSEIDARIATFQQTLEQLGLDGALIIHHTNLFYLSGTSQSSHLFIPRAGQPVLMVRKSFERACTESPIDTILEVKSLKAIPDLLKDRGFAIETLGLELDVIPYNTWQFYAKVFNDTTFSDISDVLRRLRTIKSAYEIDLLHRACGVLDQVFAEVPSWLREGMTEIELASLFEAGMRKRGYGGCSKMRAFNQDFFMGNVTSGSSGAAPTYFDGPVGGCGLTPANNPHGAGWKTIGKNEVVYIDYTCVINGYTADGARMFVLGDVSARLRQAHAAALAIQAELVGMLKPGVLCETVYAKSVELAEQMGLADHFMGMGNDRVRFIGHGVGLELDEYPIFATGVKMPLAAGMTFALEPKFVFPEGAIGTENTFVLQADGPQVLTHAPEEIVRV